MWTLCSFNLCAARCWSDVTTGCWTLTPVDLAVADGHGLQGGVVRRVLAVHFPQQHCALVLTTKPQQRQGFQHLAPNSHGNGPSPGTPELPLTVLGGLNTSMQAFKSSLNMHRSVVLHSAYVYYIYHNLHHICFLQSYMTRRWKGREAVTWLYVISWYHIVYIKLNTWLKLKVITYNYHCQTRFIILEVCFCAHDTITQYFGEVPGKIKVNDQERQKVKWYSFRQYWLSVYII